MLGALRALIIAKASPAPCTSLTCRFVPSDMSSVMYLAGQGERHGNRPRQSAPAEARAQPQAQFAFADATRATQDHPASWEVTGGACLPRRVKAAIRESRSARAVMSASRSC